MGDAGGVLTQDKGLYHKIYQLHDHGRDTDGEIKCWGRNSRMDNLQAAILNAKLEDYDAVINRRREIASMYNERLQSLEELSLPIAPASLITTMCFKTMKSEQKIVINSRNF